MTKYQCKNFELEIDYGRDSLLPPFSLATLKDRYLLGSERSPQEAFARAADAFADDAQHAQRMYDYASKLWMGFSSPVLANAGTKRGLPISCYLQHVEDSIDGLAQNIVESIRLTINGGGLGAYWGNIRSADEVTSKGSRTDGSVPFMKVIESLILAFHQGGTRRGSSALYLDISHPEVEEFIEMRRPTGGDLYRKMLQLHHGVNITDDFMEACQGNLDWELKDPHSGRVSKVVKARDLWQRILTARMETGEPYIHFIDTTNREQPIWHKLLGLKVKQSNLCSEILLPTSEERTAVCCLSSVNLELYDEWRGSDMIRDIIRFLDNVIEAFIQRASGMDGFQRAVHSAKQERSLGLGAMGFHSYLQKNGIPLECALAKSQNKTIFKYIRNEADKATKQLAEERGEAPDCTGFGVRNAHVLAVAPNASSATICGVTSPGIEPWRANAFTQKTLSGSFQLKNKYLDAIIRERTSSEEAYENAWASIIQDEGSVQKLSFLSEEEKEVFKTAPEMDQHWLVEHAADRQEFIDQGQSLNLFFPPSVDKSYLHSVHYKAWQDGVKTLYYCRSDSNHKAEKISVTECLGCES